MIPGLCSLIYAGFRSSSGIFAYLTETNLNASGVPGPIVSSTTTCEVIGGTAPYTYAWVYITGDANITPASPTNATTSFNGTIISTDDSTSAAYACNVTDSGAHMTQSNVVNMTFNGL